MPNYVLTVTAQVSCVHGGRALPTVLVPGVTVGGAPVTTQPPPYIVIGCTLPRPPIANGPCVTATWVTASLRVKAHGQPLLLLDSRATCAPTGTPLLVLQTQVSVQAQ